MGFVLWHRAVPAVVLFLAAGAWAGTDYKKWLDREVVWIISEAEKEEFEALEEDAARERFIEEFWRRRDPSPGTERNEYKEEHYRRLAVANKKFQEGIPGWKTDRGRVFIIHGPPAAEYFYESRSEMASPDRQAPTTNRSPRTIVWTYHQNPFARYYKGEIRLVFQPVSGLSRQNFVLSQSKTAQDRADQMARRFLGPNVNWMEADMRYRLVMAGPPAVVNAKGAELPNSGLGETARYMEDIFRSPGEVLEERERELLRREEARKDLHRSVRSRVSFDQLEFRQSAGAFRRRQAGDWLVSARLEIGLEQLREDKIDVYAAVVDDQGEVLDEFIDSLEFDRGALREAGEQRLFYNNSFSVPGGEYTLRTVVREVASLRAGIRNSPLRLEARAPEKLRMGSVLLTNRVEPLHSQEDSQEEPPLPLAGILYNDVQLIPNRVDRYFSGGYLFLYFQLWLPAGSPKARFNAKFIHGGQSGKRLGPHSVAPLANGFVEYGTVLPLEGFEPGEYTLQIQAFDHASRSYGIARAQFQVEAPL